MDRRTFFRYTLVAGTAGIAGCGVLQSSEEVDENYEPTAADQLAIAVGTLNKVALAVREFQQQNEGVSGEDSVATFNEEKPRDRLASAREAIATAEEMAGESQQAEIEAVRRYADGVEGTVDAVVTLIDAANSLDEAQSILDSDDIDTDAASTALDDATSASSQALTAQNEAAAALDAADGDRLADLDAEYEAMASGIDTLSEFVVGIDGLAVGYNTQVSGIDDMQTAQDFVDSDEFESAKESFTTAMETFDDAATEFSEPQSQAADSLKEQLDTGEKRSRSLNRLAAGYVSMLTGRDHVRAAETALEDDTADTARPELTEGSDAAATAADRFETGASILEDEFTAEFETAQNRAAAMQSLADGYISILDARDHIETAESHIDAEEFEPARTALADGSTDAETADETFASGQGLAEDIFASDIETARNRAAAMQSLADGYTSVLDARDHIEAAQSEIEANESEAARSSLEEASADAETADETFVSGQGLAEDLFADEFETAQNRATAMQSLADGYTSVLDSKEHIQAAESDIDAEEFESARTSLADASTDAQTADETFASGQGLAEDLFADEFETGRNRASALQSLSTGYEQLLDGRDHVEAGESAFLNDEYDAARNSFETSAEKGRQAETTFEDGAAADDEGLFADEFDQATQRATVLRSLSDGYATMVDGRQEAETGRTYLNEQRFDDAADQFRTADNRFADAEETLSAGQRNTDGQFGTQLDRALCQVGHLRTAVDHFIAAAEAGSNRNRGEFETEREAGEEALDRTDEC